MMSWDDWFNEFSTYCNKFFEEYFTFWNNFFDNMMGVKKKQPTPEEMPPLETYQDEALKHIFSSWGKKINTLCALDVGMGKTRVACEALSRLFELSAPIRLQGYALVCCPTTGVRDTIWIKTLKDLHLETLILEGEEFRELKMERGKRLFIPDLTVCLITYANIIDNIDYFINTPPNFIIFDEYHILTNNALRSDQQYREAIMKLPIRLRLGLTATPFVNDEMESVLAYGLLNNLDMVRDFRSASTVKRNSLVELVREKQKLFLFYKGGLFNPNPFSEWFVSIPMNKEHYGNYEIVKKKFSSSNMRVLHQVGKLSISPALTDKNIRFKLSNTTETGKIKALKAIISHLPDGDKLVICDNYRETLEDIRWRDFMRPLKPLLYIGGEKSDNKRNIELFNNKPENRVLLTTRQEGGEGINLQIANHIVLLNCWYTVKDIIQIIGRIKRKGQRKPTYAYIFGNNLFNCIENGLPIESYVLKEDMDFYLITKDKKKMSKKWGINVEAKWPSFKVFFNYETLENDFNLFLERIMKEAPKIAFYGMDGEIKNQNSQAKNYQDREVGKQAFNTEDLIEGESYLDQLVPGYLEYSGMMEKTIQETNSDFVPQEGIVETIPKTALLSPDMIPDLPEEDEVEVPDDIDDPGVDGPYLLSDWDAEVSGVPKTSSDMKGKIRLKKKSNSKNQKANSDFVPQERKVEPIPKIAPPKALPPDTPPVAPKE